MSHCECCHNHEIVSELKRVVKHLETLNATLDSLVIKGKVTDDRGRTWQPVVAVLKTTQELRP